MYNHAGAWKADTGGLLRVRGQPGLNSEFWASVGYLKKTKNQPNKKTSPGRDFV